MLDDLEVVMKDIKEDTRGLKFKIENIETTLPKMIRELIDYYIEQKVQPQLEQFLPKKDFKEALSVKMDYVVFNNYVKEQLQKDVVNDTEFKTEERLYTIEKSLKSQVSREDLKALLKLKASSEKLTELKEDLQKTQAIGVATAEKCEKELKKLETMLRDKTSDLEGHFQGLNAQLRHLDDDGGQDDDATAGARSPRYGSGYIGTVARLGPAHTGSKTLTADESSHPLLHSKSSGTAG
jgi:hypothetical protein